MNIKGIVLAKRDNQYDVRLENTTRNIITYVENTTGLELEIGDIVIVTYTDYNDPPIITNVYDKTISGVDSYTKTETDSLLGYKEDKVSGKGLSSNDYTDTDKSKVYISVPNTRKINSKPLTTDITLTKSDIGLGNVDNTSDTDKPISTATRTALNQIIDSIYPVGSPFFSFLVTEDPNTRFPGTTWVRLEEDQYLVSAGESLVGMTPVGANSKDIRIDWSHNHLQNPHSHENYNRTSNFSSTGNQYGGRMGIAGDNSGTITATAPTTGTNQSAGTQTNTQTVDNRPKSVAIYVWRRTA